VSALLRRAAALVLGCALALASAEGALRLAGTFSRCDDRADGALRDDERGSILCAGDSNVFGLYEASADSYPARLQALLEPDAPRIVNAGVPALNSRQLAASLPDELERLAPRALLVTIGFNNIWSWRPGGGLRYARPPWYERLALTRLARLVRARYAPKQPAQLAHEELSTNWQAGEGVATFQMRARDGRLAHATTGANQGGGAEAGTAGLGPDLAEIAALARARGTQLIVLGYGSGQSRYAETNAALAQHARALGLPFVDPSPQLEALARERGFNALFHPDLHPKALGYELVARAAAAELERLGLARVQRPLPPLPPLAQADAPRAGPRLALSGRLEGAVGSGDELAFVIEGELPQREVTVVLWLAGERGLHALQFDEVQADPLYQSTMAERTLAGRTDDAGRARIPARALIERSQAPLRGLRLCALHVLHGEHDLRVFSRIGEPIEFTLE
jgi:lysophospholipase L1-like esterase